MGLYVFYAALILYALFSSPTPDHLGWAEYLCGLLLLLSIGIIRPWRSFTRNDIPAYLLGHRWFLLYMLSIPLAIGALSGFSLTNIIRDLIPLSFLILPLCFYNKDLPRFEVILMTMGGIFAVRYIMPYLPVTTMEEAPLLYLANSPLLPFAAIYGFHMLSDPEKSFLAQRLIGMLCCLLCLAAMAFMLQRATFIVTILGCLGLLGLRSAYSPLKSLVVGTGIIIGVVVIFPFVLDIAGNLTEKTLQVGWNNRLTEWEAVLEQTTLFGLGWGSEWQSPAVADIWVRYTHNISSYYWLKAGVIGGILSLIFIWVWGLHLLKVIRDNPALGLAICIPFIIHVTLYTGFKTLDFALLLTLGSGAVTNKRCETSATTCHRRQKPF